MLVTSSNINLSVADGGGMSASGFSFQLSAPVGRTYIIQASTDLENWTPINTNVSAAEKMFFTDSFATNYSRRYYRVVVP